MTEEIEHIVSEPFEQGVDHSVNHISSEDIKVPDHLQKSYEDS